MTRALRQMIADDLCQGAAWIRSYNDAKGIVNAMIADGEIARVKPANGRGKNMIALTEKGALEYCRGRHIELIVEPTVQRKRKQKPPSTKTADEIKAARQRAIEMQRKRAEQRDKLAEHVANGGSIRGAVDLLNVHYATVCRRWGEIVAELGWQAQ